MTTGTDSIVLSNEAVQTIRSISSAYMMNVSSKVVTDFKTHFINFPTDSQAREVQSAIRKAGDTFDKASTMLSIPSATTRVISRDSYFQLLLSAVWLTRTTGVPAPQDNVAEVVNKQGIYKLRDRCLSLVTKDAMQRLAPLLQTLAIQLPISAEDTAELNEQLTAQHAQIAALPVRIQRPVPPPAPLPPPPPPSPKPLKAPEPESSGQISENNRPKRTPKLSAELRQAARARFQNAPVLEQGKDVGPPEPELPVVKKRPMDAPLAEIEQRIALMKPSETGNEKKVKTSIMNSIGLLLVYDEDRLMTVRDPAYQAQLLMACSWLLEDNAFPDAPDYPTPIEHQRKADYEELHKTINVCREGSAIYAVLKKQLEESSALYSELRKLKNDILGIEKVTDSPARLRERGMSALEALYAPPPNQIGSSSF